MFIFRIVFNVIYIILKLCSIPICFVYILLKELGGEWVWNRTPGTQPGGILKFENLVGKNEKDNKSDNSSL